MTLKERLMADFKDAMKNKDEVRKNTINLARAAINQYEVDKREELDEPGVIEILAKQVKMRRDALDDFKAAGRTDILDEYSREIDVLSEYLPEQLSEEEIQKIVEEAAAQLGITGGKKNIGKMMGAVMPKVKGIADGKAARQVIERFLG